MSIPTKKATTNNTSPFTITEEYTILHAANVGANSNKFYCIELQKHNSQEKWQLFTNYGRLEISEIYEVRNCSSKEEALQEYKRIVNSKIRKGYHKVDVIAPTVGSTNIRQQIQRRKNQIFNISSYNDKIVSLINQLNDENIHSITTTSSITYSVDKGFTTPLGPVTKEHVIIARNILNQIKDLKENNKLSINSRETQELNNEYLSLIPHNFGRKITNNDIITKDVQIIKEFELLDQLETAVTIQDSSSDTSRSLEDQGLLIEPLDNEKLFEYFVQWYEKTKSDRHSQSQGWKVKQIFKINIKDDQERWNDLGEKLNNKIDLFHGSRNCNILSILARGLLIPPYNASHVTGRLFGNGIYGANTSTKALNYSIGWWANQANKYNNSFLLITKFAMGNIYYPQQSSVRKPPVGYDSIHAKASKTGLLHDEYIVYKLGQVTVQYLIELSKK